MVEYAEGDPELNGNRPRALVNRHPELLILLIFWQCCGARRILVPGSGINLCALQWSLNLWTTRDSSLLYKQDIGLLKHSVNIFLKCHSLHQ